MVKKTMVIHPTTLGKRCNVAMPMEESKRGKREIILRIKKETGSNEKRVGRKECDTNFAEGEILVLREVRAVLGRVCCITP
jgi:hypothetical protein